MEKIFEVNNVYYSELDEMLQTKYPLIDSMICEGEEVERMSREIKKDDYVIRFSTVLFEGEKYVIHEKEVFSKPYSKYEFVKIYRITE